MTSSSLTRRLTSACRESPNVLSKVGQLGWWYSSRICWQSARDMGLSSWSSTGTDNLVDVGEDGFAVGLIKCEENAVGKIMRAIQNCSDHFADRILRLQLAHKLRRLDDPLIVVAQDRNHLEERLPVDFAVGGSRGGGKRVLESFFGVGELEGLSDVMAAISKLIKKRRAELVIGERRQFPEMVEGRAHPLDVDIDAAVAFRQQRQGRPGRIDAALAGGLAGAESLHRGRDADIAFGE